MEPVYRLPRSPTIIGRETSKKKPRPESPAFPMPSVDPRSEWPAWTGPAADRPRVAGAPPDAAADHTLEGWLQRSPPFTLSLSLHVVVLLLLALLVVRQPRSERLRLELVFGPEPGTGAAAEAVTIESPDDGAEAVPPQPEPEPQPEPTKEMASTPPAPVEPREQPAETAVAAIPFEPVAPPAPATEAVAAVAAPSVRLALTGRSAGRREELLAAGGGGGDTETAVEMALDWLVRNQEKSGLWSLRGPYLDGSKQENRLAATAMALLALQGAGNTTKEGLHQAAVAKAWKILLAKQGDDGTFDVGQVPEQHSMYAHAQATIALCELYGMTQDVSLRKPAEQAISFALNAQMPDGGWRYGVPDPLLTSPVSNKGDMSVTGWFVMALKSAEMAGIPIPAKTYERLTAFLDAVFVSDLEGYGYQIAPHQKYFSKRPALTAEAILARLYLGMRRDDPHIESGIKVLFRVLPYRDCPLDEPKLFASWGTGPWGPPAREIFVADTGLGNAPNRHPEVYSWYYATQVCHHVQGEPWRQWNAWMRATLPINQVTKGRERGSWDPDLDMWGSNAGRLFMTCMCTCMLEVYYRHLPLFSAVE
jgi:hypothetical protein